MDKWFVSKNKFSSFPGHIWFVPCISIWYDKNTFLETGVETPAFGVQIAWLKWSYGFTIQKGY
jgi:hypothetical protein